MRCPTLSELPPPPPGKTGWPWTEESPQLPDTMPDGSPWPRVSIVTPSYNQGQFIEETIRSVLLQGYPNLEYIIIDGGSTDNSVEIIRKYEPWLAYWVSEKDDGQCDAINKGWQQSTGGIAAWLNSDDAYRPNALAQVARAFGRHVEAVAVIGACAITDAELNVTACKLPKGFQAKELVLGGAVPGQPSVFLKTRVIERIGGLDKTLHYVLDWEYWLRVGMHYSLEQMVLLNVVLSDARCWEGSKSAIGVARTAGYRDQRNATERRAVLDKMFARPDLPLELKRLRALAYGNTYLTQARYELEAGQARAARQSLRRAYKLSGETHGALALLRLLAQSYLGARTVRRLKKATRLLLEKTHALPLFLRLRTRRRLIKVPIDKLRCQEKPFSELQGFSGKPIACFPPSLFYKMGLTDPKKAHDAFRQWLHECFIDMEAWRVHPSEGGWANGSLMNAVFQVHQEHDIALAHFEQAVPTLIDQAIGRRATYYLDLLNSLRGKGYNRALYPPILCRDGGGLYFIHNGHHRVAALWALGYQEADVVLVQ